LVEVLIATVITLVLFLALMQSALLSININMRNLLREEAVQIVDDRMREIRNLPFASADLLQTGTPPIFVTDTSVQRDFRKITAFTYNLEKLVDDLTTNTKQVDLQVSWTWEGEPYTHTVSTILNNQLVP
jgi:Tfp pilus assembly protein PilV